MRKTSALKWALVLLPLAYLWFRLINNLRLEWTTDPQYGYGLLVPFLCIGLLVRRLFASKDAKENRNSENRKQKSISASRISIFYFPISAFYLLAFLYLPTRLVEAAVPEWRPIQWSLGVIAIGLTLCVISTGLGRGWLRQLAFPICFFFVAIPWPTLFETPIIQHLTRISAAIVIELLGWIGIPALAHGNVIEVSTGMVGIDEACSGIRSFQSSLMISLFFGEFYRLSTGRRWLLVPLGFLLSIAFNVCRMSLLTFIAAKKGVPAISEYHDEAGITIAILCTLALWGIAAVMRHRSAAEGQKSEVRSQKSVVPNRVVGGTSDLRPPTSGSVQLSAFTISAFKNLSGLGLSLVIWLLLVEGGVQLWYHVREAHLKPGPDWTLTFPRDNPTLKDIPMDAATRRLLRFDSFKQAAWTEADGTEWEAFYFNWLPGRVAGYLAKRHTPEICLAATGIKLLSGPKLTMMNVHGVELPIRCYQFQTPDGVIQVFQCRWEAGVGEEAYVAHESARYNLIRAIWAGRGDKGQKVLEIVISGMSGPEQAKAALERELEKLIVVKHSAAPKQTAESREQKSAVSGW